MKNVSGTIGFFLAGLGVFRLVYGAWPPSQGSFSQWVSSDPHAKGAIAAGLVAGVVGALVARSLSKN
jgi:cytochrome b